MKTVFLIPCIYVRHYLLMSFASIFHFLDKTFLFKERHRLIHVNVWQKPLQYCKVISLQLIKIIGKKLRLKQNKVRHNISHLKRIENHCKGIL